MNAAIDPIEELVARSKDTAGLRKFHEFHRTHPEVLDFLVTEIRLRLENFDAFSFYSLWEYARWKLERKRRESTFLMNDHCIAFYARAITIIYPAFNGRAEFRKSAVDDIFGTRVEPVEKRRRGSYSRRLQWADGTSLEGGWRPSGHHVAVAPGNRRRDLHAR
jgi:hypothetical protein